MATSQSDPRDTLAAVSGDLPALLLDVHSLIHNQRVPLIEKVRAQRIYRTLGEVRDELLQMERRAGQPGWIVQSGQEDSGHDDAASPSGEDPAPGQVSDNATVSRN